MALDDGRITASISGNQGINLAEGQEQTTSLQQPVNV